MRTLFHKEKARERRTTPSPGSDHHPQLHLALLCDNEITIHMMSFGFSVGDFIAALELVGTVVASLREAGGAKAQFKELTHELFALETALMRVKQLDFEDDDAAEYAALREVACQCQYSITAFWKTTTSYQRHLLSEAKRPNVKTMWMKVQWSLFKQEELVRFKADVAAHTQSLQLLLAAFQTKQLQAHRKDSQAGVAVLKASIRLAAQQCMAKLLEVSSAVGSNFAQGQQILQTSVRIVQSNIRIYQAVCSMQSMLKCLPPQIERQQPVYMIDALGKMSPFHLEFVRSAAALQAVLRANFERVPSGTRKIDNGEFVIYESATGRQVDLARDWETCLLPGQRIDMRMVFERGAKRRNVCPACRTRCGRAKTKHSDIECPACGLIFGRVEELQDVPDVPGSDSIKSSVRHYALAFSRDVSTDRSMAGLTPPQTAFDESEDVQNYRRIRILQRRRRRVWDTDDLIASNGRGDDGGPADLEAGQETGSTELAPDSIHDLGLLDGMVDINTFEQVLEMDDDDEREFSSFLVVGNLQEVSAALAKAKPLVHTQPYDLRQVNGLFHFTKGTSTTIGLQEIKDIALDIQLVAANYEYLTTAKHGSAYSLDEEGQVRFLRDRLLTFEERLEAVSTQLHKFYRVERDDSLCG